MMSKLVIALALGSAAAASSAGAEDDKKAHLRGLKMGYHTVPAPEQCKEFRWYDVKDPGNQAAAGWTPITSAEELNGMKAEFVGFYNNNGGLKPVAPISIQGSCLISLRDDQGSILNLAITPGATSPSDGFYPAFEESGTCSDYWAFGATWDDTVSYKMKEFGATTPIYDTLAEDVVFYAFSYTSSISRSYPGIFYKEVSCP